MVSKVTIISEAYNYLGQPSVNDLDTGNPRDAAVSGIYDTLYPSLLSTRNWSFALTHQKLAKITGPLDLVQWNSGYQLPTDPKWLRTYRTDPLTDFHMYGSVIYTNASALSIDYVFQPLEVNLPSYFVTLFTYSLTAKIAMLVTQMPSLVELWQREAGIAFSIATSIDSQNQPNRVISDLPYFLAKFNSG